MTASRANVVSSFTVIKGALIDETYAVFRAWDTGASAADNLRRLQEDNWIGAASANWSRDVAKVLRRRFDPGGRDRPLVALAKAGAGPDLWRPALLWHMTRDEFLVRDFLAGWLYPRYAEGAFRLRTEDVLPYLADLHRRGLEVAESWSDVTTKRVAAGLLRLAVDFGLMTGSVVREFASYHLSDDALLYVAQAMAEGEPNARRLMAAPDWRMYLMDAGDVEREILRLHQFRRLDYQVPGSLAQLSLPYASLAAYVEGLAA